MLYFLDCEFIEDGKTIDLISIAVVCEDGREFLRYNWDCDLSKANDWVKANVLAHLPPKPLAGAYNDERGLWRNHGQIATEMLEFVGGSEPVFWADYGAYDWVALCQLFGPMVALPKGWPMFVREIQQFKEAVFGDPWPVAWPQPQDEHDALSDARNVRDRYNHIAEAAWGIVGKERT